MGFETVSWSLQEQRGAEMELGGVKELSHRETQAAEMQKPTSTDCPGAAAHPGRVFYHM